MRKSRRNLLTGLAFVSPFLIGFSVFTIYPILASFYFSFTYYPIFSSPEWVGAKNYVELFHDRLFWTALYNTIYYTVFSVPLGIITALSLALLLNMKVKGLAVYRTIFFLPTIVPIVASSVLWLWIFNPQYGLINSILRLLHLPAPGWLTDPRWAKPALILMSMWGVGGSVVLYLAGLQDVPEQLYEAAELDGASAWAKTIHITLPMLSPVIFFTLIMGLIGSFQYFTQAWIMTSGGPDNATLFYALYLFNNAFQYFRLGYASAMAWILFIIILGATLLVFKVTGRFVYYGGVEQ